MNKSLNQSGFSLIELMIAIAVFAILISFAVPSYQAWIANTKVRTATESILNGMQRARSESLMRNTPVRFSLGANSAWLVECVTAATCPDLTAPPGQVEARSNEEGGTQNIVVNSGGNSALIFNNLGIRSTAANQISQVDLSLEGSDRPLRITVGAGGTVRMCDPSTGLSDPRRC